MQTLSLPAIMDHVGHINNLKSFRFLQPQRGSDILPSHEHDSPRSPASSIFALCTLTIPAETIIPFHQHGTKEKRYVLITDGALHVLMWRADTMHTYVMNRGGDLIIPPNTPHAIINHCIDPCKIHITASTQNASDVKWEAGIEDLILNNHRKAA